MNTVEVAETTKFGTNFMSKEITELTANLKNQIYNNIISDFINYSDDDVKNKIKIIISEEMESIKYALLSEHSNVVILRQKYKIYENLKKEL
jgi:hypothetical protein